MPTLTFLALSAPGFACHAAPAAAPGEPGADFGAELMHRAVLDARRRGGFDALVIAGDILRDGSAPGARQDLALLARRVGRLLAGTPCLAVAGAGDGAPEVAASAFGAPAAGRAVEGWRLADAAGADGARGGASRAQQPAAALQHATGFSVLLTGDGRLGGSPSSHEGVLHYAVPPLRRSPFPYALVRADGRDVRVEEHRLRLPDSPLLFDVHAHTHYAYCSEDVTPFETLLRARTFGLAGICLTEHADQLYLSPAEHAQVRVFTDDDYWRTARSAESERMARYRSLVEPLAGGAVKLGVEIELDRRGRPALRPEHARGWDLRLGAVHWLAPAAGGLPEREAKELFLDRTRRLLDAGVDVLAHPFRFFRRGGGRPPEDLYPVVAGMLAEHGAAAEVNFHTNRPDPAFLAECIARGVKLALGSDAHALHEVGDFHPHLAVVREAAGRSDVEGLLWAAPWRGG